MKRQLSLTSLALASLVLLPLGAEAQRPRLKIDGVKMGFLLNPQQGEFKSGAWTPVYVSITAPPEGLPEATLSIECADSDDVRNSYSVPIRSLEPNESTVVLTYIRPGSSHGEVVAKVRIKEYLPYELKENYVAMPLGQVLYVGIGERLVGLRRSLANEHKAANKANQQGDEEDDPLGRDTGPRRLAFVDDIRQVPTRWFAYEGVDILLLTTGNREFVEKLLNDQEGRKEAIAEWVRRGGRLVISTGSNLDIFNDERMAPIRAMLPADIAGRVQLPRVRMLERYAPTQVPSAFENPKPRNNPEAPPPPIDVAKLAPRPSKLAEASLKERDDLPLRVSGAHGLGRVTILAFDLDREPFTKWGGQLEFWKKFRRELGREPTEETAMNPNMMWQMQQNNSQDVASKLQNNLEEFEDVQVISFGWVALFILIYILVVGPLDYFFLKKVVKRLELTWVTFPTVVIAISVAAYFLAYYLKGNDQRINKVDLVDFDLQGQEAFGQTWFTIFSPRIQHYTIGVEPAAPDWCPQKNDPSREASVVVTWMGRPEVGFGGTGRAGSQSLFRRTYEYEPGATGLRGVPIQVWTTKSFSASWELPFDANRPPFQADLRYPLRKPDLLTGTIRNDLPVELEEVYLFQNRGEGGKWYSLDRLQPHETRRVDALIRGDGKDTKGWITAPSQAPAIAKAPQQPTRRGFSASVEATPLVLKRMLFQEAEQANNRRSSSPLRFLDQSWRLRNQEELILVGRVARKEGQAEDVTRDPASATRLWLGGLPNPKEARPTLQGTLSQETYVRVFLPVRVTNPEPEPAPKNP